MDRLGQDIRIALRLDGVGTEVGVFLPIRVTKEIEAPYLVGTIGFAEPCSDAAILNLDIQSLTIVHGGRHRTDGHHGRRRWSAD